MDGSPSLLTAAEPPIFDQMETLTITDPPLVHQSVECSSLLEKLPKELLMKIIEFASEAVFELRLTSRLLHSLVDESARMKATVPIVEKLKIHEQQFPPDISLYVPKCNSNLFEHRLKMHDFSPELRSQIKLCGRGSAEARHHVYRLNFSVLIRDETMIDCLRECMGTRIEKAMLYGCDDRAAIAAAANLLEGIHFVQLSIWVNPLSDDVDSLLLKSDLMNNVEQLAISVGEVKIADPVQTLLHLASDVPSLHIEQNSVMTIDHRSSYFFGVYDADWAKIIVEMFKGKMGKLYIENYFFTGYLSSKAMDELRDRLPTFGKHIWFSASCSKDYINQFTPYVRNEHSIKASRDRHVVRRPGTPRPHSLSVKHQSREGEHFETFYPYVSAFHYMAADEPQQGFRYENR